MVRVHRLAFDSVVVVLAGLLAACGYSAPSTTTPGTTTPSITTLTLNPSSIAGGQTVTATVTLDQAAEATGEMVTLTANTSVLTMPAFVTVLAGKTTATFKIETQLVGSPQVIGVNATLITTVQTTLTITPVTALKITGLTLNPASIPSGNTTQGVVTISAPAFPAGQTVNLISGSALVTVPSPITVPAGTTRVAFSVFTSAVTAPTNVTLTAELNGVTMQTSLMLTLPAPTLSNFSFQPNPVVGGTATTGTVFLTLPAPAGGIPITLTSTDTVVAPVPASVMIPAGATQAQFMFTPIVVKTAQAPVITATQNIATLNATIQNVTLNIVPSAVVLTAVTLNPSTTTGGLSTFGVLSLSTPAPQGGTVVQLMSSNTSAATVLPSVTVVPGNSFALFPIQTSPVATTQMVTITATLGTSNQTATLTVDAASALTVSSLTLNPTTVLEGDSSTGTVTISGLAQPGGTTVALMSSDPSVTFQPSANLLITAGTTGATFTAVTTAGTPANATITATLNATSKMATLAVVPSPTLVSVTLMVSTLAGGSNSSGTVTISAAAPGGIPTVISLMSNDAAVQVPTSVTVAPGNTTANFTVTTLQVTSIHMATITGTAMSGGPQMAMLTVTPPPPVVSEIFFNPPTVTAGQSSTGTLILSSPAPAGGVMVTLSLPAGATAVTLPVTSIPVAAGASTVTFVANSAAGVGASTTVQVTATLNTLAKMNGLTVIPAPAGTVSEQIVVGGETSSPDFPHTSGAFQTVLTGADSGTLTSINLSTTGGATTSTDSFSTFLGNSNLGQVRDTFVDSSGNVFVCGVTSDSALPTSTGAIQKSYGGGNSDAFVAEFSGTGSVQFLTYLGGSGDDSCNSIVVDSTGNIFISGRSNSTDLVGPTTTPPVIQPHFNNGTGSVGSDFFIAKLAPKAASTTWLTFLGGLSDDQASGRIAIDSMGDVFVSGKSQSLTDFPVSATQGRPGMLGVSTFGVVVKIHNSGAFIDFTTFIFGKLAPSGVSGGTTVDASGGMAINSAGVIYVCGAASATDIAANFPNVFQPALKGTQDAYVAEISATGAITALTLLGGTSSTAVQACKGLAIDSEGNVIVTTATDASDYFLTTGPALDGPSDFAVTKLTPDLGTVIFSRLVGGSGSESADATRVELDPGENIYFSLATNSPDFPVTANALQAAFSGTASGANNNMAIVKLSADGSTILYGTYLGGSNQNSTITLRYHHN
jgi:trimeric autotransporter adhesin